MASVRFRADLEEKFAKIAAAQLELNERMNGIEARLKEAQETVLRHFTPIIVRYFVLWLLLP